MMPLIKTVHYEGLIGHPLLPKALLFNKYRDGVLPIRGKTANYYN
jgi:hypothetical protein